jgi:hypothetical protein
MTVPTADEDVGANVVSGVAVDVVAVAARLAAPLTWTEFVEPHRSVAFT